MKKSRRRKRLIKDVEKACFEGDVDRISSAILSWAVKTFPERSFISLADVRRLFEGKSDSFVQRLEELEQFLYGTGRFAKHIPEAKETLGKDVLSAFSEASQMKIRSERKKKTRLPQLYPDESASS